jgi:DNA-directed RNA polymerase specialized sigma24 family protein
MRRMRRKLERGELVVCERIIERYAPYVLVRCAGYTDGRRQAQEMGVYVLVTTCVIANRLMHLLPVGVLVDFMVDVVGSEVAARGRDPGRWDEGEELLIADEEIRQMAKDVNGLPRPLREVLVLHYVTGMQVSSLARLWSRPVRDVAADLAHAEEVLRQKLAERQAGGEAGGVNVRTSLGQFAAGLDLGWIGEVATCALEELAKEMKRGHEGPQMWIN